MFRKLHFLEALEILEILESPQTVENIEDSDHFLEILEILEIPPMKRPLSQRPLLPAPIVGRFARIDPRFASESQIFSRIDSHSKKPSFCKSTFGFRIQKRDGSEDWTRITRI